MRFWAAALVFAVFAILPTCAFSGILVSLDQRGDPVVEYSSRPSTERINFADVDPQTYEVVRSKFWEVLGPCAMDLDSWGIKLRDCKSPRFKLTWDGIAIDRRYLPVLKLKNGGALVFTQYVNARGANGLEDWTVRAPQNGVAIFQDKKSNSTLTIAGQNFDRDGRGWIYLGPDTFTKNDHINLLVDVGVSASIRDLIEKYVPEQIAQQSGALGSPLKTRPSLFVTWIDRDKPSRIYQADTVPGNVIRFTFSGSAWKDLQPETLDNIRAVLAHELTHLWNAGVYSSAQSNSPWLHEGNAELLSLSSLHSLGVLSTDAAAARLNDAIARCIYIAKDRPWVKIPDRNRGDFPYACGLAIQFALVARPVNTTEVETAYEFWRKLWTIYPAYDEVKLREFVWTNGDKGTANALTSLLSDPEIPLSDALRKLLSVRGVAVEPSSTASAALKRSIQNDLVRALLSADCATPPSYFLFDDRIQIADDMKCKHFAVGAIVTELEGIPLSADSMRSVVAIKMACQSTTAAYNMKFGGGEVRQVPCTPDLAKQLPVQPNLFCLRKEDITRVLYHRTQANQ